LSAIGGNGGKGGGRGGNIFIASRNRLVTSGALDVSGGSAATTCTQGTCQGGDAGRIELGAIDSPLRSAAALTARGGATPAGAGGRGGTIFVRRALLSNPPNAANAADIEVSGALDASGGAGGEGGDAGTVDIQSERPSGSGVVTLLGYASFDLSGGAGVSQGGAGGSMVYENLGLPDALPSSARHVHVHPRVVSRGGDGLQQGGAGGRLSLRALSAGAGSSLVPSVLLANEVDLASGSGKTAGGGGSAVIAGRNDVVVLAEVTLRGVRGTDASRDARSAGAIEARSDQGSVDVFGDIDVRGSDSDGREGGNAGTLTLEGRVVRLLGAVRASGSAGSPGGGDGGTVRIRSRESTSVVGANIDVRGGVGEVEAGAPGTLSIDAAPAP
jgi:hypothetical protein